MKKDHYTVLLTAKADDTKMKSYVVFKGKGTRLIKKLEKIPGIVVRSMNSELTIVGPSFVSNACLFGMLIKVLFEC